MRSCEFGFYVAIDEQGLYNSCNQIVFVIVGALISIL
jgi:hypothetical protein